MHMLFKYTGKLMLKWLLTLKSTAEGDTFNKYISIVAVRNNWIPLVFIYLKHVLFIAV